MQPIICEDDWFEGGSGWHCRRVCPQGKWEALGPGDCDTYRSLDTLPEVLQVVYESGVSTNEVVFFLKHPHMFNMDTHQADPPQGNEATQGMPHLAQIVHEQEELWEETENPDPVLSQLGKQAQQLMAKEKGSHSFNKAAETWLPLKTTQG